MEEMKTEKDDFTGRRICVAGVGAIGTVMAAMIGQRYASSLSLIARGKRAQALKEEGLVLHSQFYGERSAFPAAVSDRAEDLGMQDFVLICVKNYSLEKMAEGLRPCIGPDTVIVPVMNGIEASGRLREMFPESIIADAVIYCATGINDDFSAVQRGNYAHIFIGSEDPDRRQQEGALSLHRMLESAGFDSRFTERIISEKWQKFVHNCAFNTITARYGITSGQLRRDETCRRDLRRILTEGYRTALACGIEMPEDFVDRKFDFTTRVQAESATSSMKQDVDAGRPTELDAFLGALIRKADLCGLEVPAAREYYRALGGKS